MRYSLLQRQVVKGPDRLLAMSGKNVYKTDAKMLKANIDFAINSGLSLMKVNLKEYKSTDMMKMVDVDGNESEFDRAKHEVDSFKKIHYLGMNQSMNFKLE